MHQTRPPGRYFCFYFHCNSLLHSSYRRLCFLPLVREREKVTDMSKSRRLGFTAYQPTDESFIDLFKQLRADRLIP